jgi:hypothetical protein
LSLSRADPHSFDWLWTTNFAEWVKTIEQKVFWVTGKPASGKSMLMKYITQLECKDLQFSQPCLTIRFFFNYAAEAAFSKANTIEGLHRCVLDQICKKVPRLSRTIVEHFDLDGELRDEWRLSCDIISKITSFVFDELERIHQPIFLCLDGLDDYRGDLCEVVELVQNLSEKPAILKLCIASRPLEFGRQFGHWPQLHMERYNKRAIYINAFNKLSRQCSMACLEQQKKKLMDIADGVAEKSAGVFLWAELATGELCNLLRRNGDLNEHPMLLQKLPTTLLDYYKRVFTSLGDDDKHMCGMLILLIKSAKEQIWISQLYEACYHLRLLTLSDDCDRVTDLALVKFIDRFYQATGGLLGLTYIQDGEYEHGFDDNHPSFGQTIVVDEPHRTLYNFLDSNDNWRKYFDIAQSESQATATWLTLAEANLSRPLEYDGEADMRMYFTARRSKPLEWPRDSPSAANLLSPYSSWLIMKSLYRYMASHLVQHMLNYESLANTAVPTSLLQVLESNNYISAHWQTNMIGCDRCGFRNDWGHTYPKATTIPQMLLVHECSLTLAEHIASELARIRKELWMPAQWAVSEAGQRVVAERFLATKDGEDLIKIARLMTDASSGRITGASSERMVDVFAAACCTTRETIVAAIEGASGKTKAGASTC